jgi:hypothetical protein
MEKKEEPTPEQLESLRVGLVKSKLCAEMMFEMLGQLRRENKLPFTDGEVIGAFLMLSIDGLHHAKNSKEDFVKMCGVLWEIYERAKADGESNARPEVQ